MGRRLSRKKRRATTISGDGTVMSFKDPTSIGSSIKTSKSKTGHIATRDASPDFYQTIMGILPNPDPVLKRMGKSISVYKDLMSDSRVKAATGSRRSGVTAMDWELDQYKANQKAYDVIMDLFDSLDMHSLWTEILDAVYYGYKPIELIYKKIGSYVLPVKIIPKPPEWFTFGDKNELRFLTRNNMITGIPVSPQKFITATHEADYNNPYGNPVMSAVFWPVKFRQNGYRFWTTFLEKYGMPWIKGKAPIGAKEADIEAMATMLEDMVQDAIAVVPGEYDIDMVSGSGGERSSSSGSYDQYIAASNVEIAVAILGGNLSTEVRGGSYAAAQAQMDVRSDLIDNDSRIVERVMNRIIELTYHYNFSGDRPVFRLSKPTEVSKEKAETDAILREKLGVVFTKKYITERYGLGDDDFIYKIDEEEPETDTVPDQISAEEDGDTQ